jgi:hypothetical protein
MIFLRAARPIRSADRVPRREISFDAIASSKTLSGMPPRCSTPARCGGMARDPAVTQPAMTSKRGSFTRTLSSPSASRPTKGRPTHRSSSCRVSRVQRSSYDPATNAWTTFTSLPGTNSAMGLTTGPDGRIYVIGGIYFAALNTVYATQPAATVSGTSATGTLIVTNTREPRARPRPRAFRRRVSQSRTGSGRREASLKRRLRASCQSTTLTP